MLQDKDLVSIQEVRQKVDAAYSAFQKFRSFTQEQVDSIVEAMAAAARTQAEALAMLAVEETGYGNVKDKTAKNLLNADILPRRMQGMKTIGVLREIPEQKIVEIGVPVGVVAAILPTTNPTSTAIFKTLIALKSGNAIVVSPHPNAFRSTCATVDVLSRAAQAAGAPEGLIQCIHTPTTEGTTALMRHERTGVILATGGHGIVQAAYSSGNPAYGVGPGNVPVLIEQSAIAADAVAKIVEGKSFDFGTVCSSEQAIVCEESQRTQVVAALKENRAYFCNDVQKDALRCILLTPRWTVNPKCVGQSPQRIAELAGFAVPPETSILVVELAQVGKQEPLSAEKLSPVLALYVVPDFAAGLATCESLLRFGGLGHTCVIYSQNDERVREFGLRMPAFRVLVNTPAPQGSTGITTNVFPSMTLGCGAVAGNITSDNVGPMHLLNVKRVAWEVRKASDAFSAPSAQPVDKPSIAAAVDRYLSGKGLAAPPRAVVEEVVDRFLASKKTPAPATPSCACELPAAPQPEPPPPPAIVPFVCEADVRDAIAAGRKIFIGPRTIVTPSARDLGADILVQAQRQ
ncbi:MAG: aldehyde dehydrogenase family protein [Bryobacterales bacterium]|nr:aldehyde dehydrogenase family protein [Bryobacterales bacterium]